MDDRADVLNWSRLLVFQLRGDVARIVGLDARKIWLVPKRRARGATVVRGCAFDAVLRLRRSTARVAQFLTSSEVCGVPQVKRSVAELQRGVAASVVSAIEAVGGHGIAAIRALLPGR